MGLRREGASAGAAASEDEIMKYRIVWVDLKGNSGASRLYLSLNVAAALMEVLRQIHPSRLYDIEPVTLRRRLK